MRSVAGDVSGLTVKLNLYLLWAILFLEERKFTAIWGERQTKLSASKSMQHVPPPIVVMLFEVDNYFDLCIS